MGGHLRVTNLEPQRRFRAVVTCATCRSVVTGPAANYEPAAAFQLGAVVAHTFELHAIRQMVHTKCGGALQVTVEEIPPEARA